MITGRFAPSPSGRMHMGNIFAAVVSYASAKSRGGRWVLRMEDLDTQRCKPEYASQLLDDLCWLGLTADEGAGIGGPNGPYYQSQRTSFYDAAFDKLQALGLTYECFCSRQDLTAASAPHASDGHTIYARTCLRLTDNQRNEMRSLRKPAWRLQLPEETSTFTDGHYGFQTAHLTQDRGDIILRRADGNYAYNLAVVVDDALMGVNEVVRARDLLTSAHEQSFLFRALGYTPPTFRHFPLLVAPDGARLSKRDRSLALDRIRERVRPDELIGLLAHIIGMQEAWHPMPLEQFVANFSWDTMPKEDIVVDSAALF